MTLPRERQASKRIERQQLIQEIKQQNPNVTDEQLSKYNIDDLRKIKMATAPKAETEKLSQVEQFDRDSRTGKFSQQYDTFRQPRMQYGGIADMSAAPMIKQPQQKKRKASGFRAKYS